MVHIVLKICILMLLVLASSGLSSAAEQNANSNPCNVSETDAAGFNGDFSVDIHAFQKFTDTASRILKEEKFVEIDCLADRARSGKERLPGGLWKIHLLYQGLQQPVPYPVHATQEDWTGLLQRLHVDGADLGADGLALEVGELLVVLGVGLRTMRPSP